MGKLLSLVVRYLTQPNLEKLQILKYKNAFEPFRIEHYKQQFPNGFSFKEMF